MTTATKARNASALVSLSGRNKSLREMAFMKIAPLSYSENMSRAETITNLKVALGDKPSDDQRAVAQREWIIGRVACRLPAGELPKPNMEGGDKLEFARVLVCSYAAPPKEGTTPRKLRKGQLGRRSAMQHRVVRAAEEAWSQIAAELGAGDAMTQAERNAAKKRENAPSAPGAKAGTKGQPSKGAAAPSHSELVAAPKPETADVATQHIVTQAAALLAYCNKNAKLIPLAFSEAVIGFKALINTAANDYALDKAERAAREAKRAAANA
jgi:hypothetical protein